MRKFSEKKKKRNFSDRIKTSLKKHQSPKYLKELKYEQIQDWVDENKMKKDNITDPIEQYDNHDLGYPIEQDIYDRMQTWVRDHFEQIRNREDLLDKADITIRDYLFSVFPGYREAFPLLNKGITESKTTPREYVEPTSFSDNLLRFMKKHKAEYITSFIKIGKHNIQLDLVNGCEYKNGDMYFIKNSDNPEIKTKFSEKVPFNNLVYIEFLSNDNITNEKVNTIQQTNIDPNKITDKRGVEKGHKCKFGYYEVIGKIKFNNVEEIYGKRPLGYKNLIDPKIISEGLQDNIKSMGSKILDKTSKAVKNTASNIYKYADEKAKKYGGKLYNDLTKKDFSVLDFGKDGILFDFGDDDKIGLEYKFKISKNNCQLANKKALYETYFYGIDNIINYEDVKKALGLGSKKGDSENCLLAIPNKTYKFPNDDSEDFFYIIKRKVQQEALFKLTNIEEEELTNKEEEKEEKVDNKKEKVDTDTQKNDFRLLKSDELELYMVIEHPKFGVGKIIELRDDGKVATIRFNTVSDKPVKDIFLDHVKLKIVN